MTLIQPVTKSEACDVPVCAQTRSIVYLSVSSVCTWRIKKNIHKEQGQVIQH